VGSFIEGLVANVSPRRRKYTAGGDPQKHQWDVKMNESAIVRFLENPDFEAFRVLWSDDKASFAVDWREPDDDIIGYCESVLQTGCLSAENAEADNECDDLYINYRGTRTKVPLACNGGDRHVTLCALNDVLAPDYQIRWIVISHGSDTLGFVPLPSGAWRSLESRYPQQVAENFLDPRPLPNLFTVFVDDDLPEPAKSHWQRVSEAAPRGRREIAAASPPPPENAQHGIWKVLLAIGVSIVAAAFAATRGNNPAQHRPKAVDTKALSEQMDKDIREGKASDFELILNGIDSKEYRRNHPPTDARGRND
jgi:hypothetical protein